MEEETWIDMYQSKNILLREVHTESIRQHGSAVYVGMVVVVCIP